MTENENSFKEHANYLASQRFEDAWRIIFLPNRFPSQISKEIRKKLDKQRWEYKSSTHTGTLEEKERIDNIFLGLYHYKNYETNFKAKYSDDRKN